MTRSKWFAMVFIGTALLISYLFMQRIPHDVMLHINDKWHVMLVTEEQTNHIRFDPNQFTLLKQNQANLWLTGKGELDWKEHTITVSDRELTFNDTVISTSARSLVVNLFFYPDGRVLKGKASLK